VGHVILLVFMALHMQVVQIVIWTRNTWMFTWCAWFW